MNFLITIGVIASIIASFCTKGVESNTFIIIALVIIYGEGIVSKIEKFTNNKSK